MFFHSSDVLPLSLAKHISCVVNRENYKFFPPFASAQFGSHFVSFSRRTRIQSLASCGSRRNTPFVSLVSYPCSCATGVSVEDRTKPRSPQSRTPTPPLAPCVLFCFWARPALRERINGRRSPFGYPYSSGTLTRWFRPPSYTQLE